MSKFIVKDLACHKFIECDVKHIRTFDKNKAKKYSEIEIGKFLKGNCYQVFKVSAA